MALRYSGPTASVRIGMRSNPLQARPRVWKHTAEEDAEDLEGACRAGRVSDAHDGEVRHREEAGGDEALFGVRRAG